MNEQAIIDSYNLFVGSGYKKSLQEFKQLLASNPDAVNDSYGLFQQNGYRKSLDEYKTLMGIGAAVESPMATKTVEEQPKKKEATVSPFVAGGSGPTKFDPRTGQVVQDTPEFATAKPEVKVPAQKLPELSQFGFQPGKGLPAQKTAPMPKFIEDQLRSITPDITGKTEETVVPQLEYQFGPLGFKFEEIDAGDFMKATSPSGESIRISLDITNSDAQKAETNKLNAFLRKGASTLTNLSTLQKQYTDANKKITSQKELDESLAIINTEEANVMARNAEFAKLQTSLEAERARLESVPPQQRNNPEYIARANDFISKADQFTNDFQTFAKDANDLVKRGQQLNKSIGKYTEMKAQQGTWYGAGFNALVNKSFYEMAKGFSGVAIDFIGEIIPTKALMSQDDYEKNFIEQAKKEGISVSEGQDFISLTSQLDADTIARIENRIRDVAKKSVRGEVIGSLDKASKMAMESSGVSPEYYRSIEETLVGGALLGTLSSIPAMAGGPVMRTVLMGSQVLSGIDAEMDNDPDFADISQNERYLVKGPIATAVAILENLGLSNLLNQKGFLNNLVLRALGKVGVGASYKTFAEVIQNEIGSAVGRGALTLGAGFLAEAETGALQEVADITAKSIYNMAKEKEMFDTPDSVVQFIEQVGKAGLQEGIGAGVLAVPGSVSAAYRGKGFLGMDDSQFAMFEKMANDSNIQKGFVARLKSRINAGEITAAQGKDILNNYRNAVGLFNSLPENLNMKGKKEAMNLLKERRDLERQIDGKDQALTVPQRNRINQINQQLTGLSETSAKEGQPTYKVDGKDVTVAEINELINTKSKDELLSMNIQIENDNEGVAERFQAVLGTPAAESTTFTDADRARKQELEEGIASASARGITIGENLTNELETLNKKEQDAVQEQAAGQVTAEAGTQGELKVGSTIKWDVFGNEEIGDWDVVETTNTRGGQPAVVLSKVYVEDSVTGALYTKEYADRNGIKYNNESTILHTVPLADLQALKAEPQVVTQEGQVQEQIAEIERRKNKARTINSQPFQRSNPEGDNINFDRGSTDVKRIGASIDKKINSGKTSDEIIQELGAQGVVAKTNTLDRFREFISDRQSGKTTQTFEQWYNETVSDIDSEPQTQEGIQEEVIPASIQPEIDIIEAQRRQELEANKAGLDKPYYLGETDGPTLREFINQEYDAKIEELKAKTVPQQVQEEAVSREAKSPADFAIELQDKYGVELDFLGSPESETLSVSRIVVPKGQRGQGIGAKVMEEIVQYADSNNKKLVLTPSKDFGGTSVKRLTDFYKRFGFVENKGKNKDFTIRDTMYRSPEGAVKEEAAPKKPRPVSKKKNREEIISRPAFTPTALARQWLLSGGKLRSTQSEENKVRGVGVGKGVREETGMGGIEMRQLVGIIDNKRGLSPEVAAERIYENLNEELQASIDPQDIRDAIIEVVLSEDRKTWIDNQDRETSENQEAGLDEYIYSQLTDEERADYDQYKQEESYNEYRQENAKKLAKEYDAYVKSKVYQDYIEEVYERNREGRPDAQNQNDGRGKKQGADGKKDSVQEKKQVEDNLDELLKLDPKDRSAAKKALDYLDGLLKGYDKIEKEGLGVNIALPVIKKIIQGIRALVQAGVNLSDAIKQVAKENNVSVEDVVNGIDEIGKQRKKSAPSAAKILGKPRKKVTVDEMAALKDQIKLEARAAREAKGDLNTKRKALAAKIIAARKRAVINAIQARALVNKISRVNLDNPIMVDRLVEYIDKVFDNANYATEMTELRKLQKQARSRKHTSMTNLVKQFTSINPETIPLDRIQDYKEALDFLNTRTPFYGKMNEVFDEMLSYKAAEKFDAVKTKDALMDKYKSIMDNKLKILKKADTVEEDSKLKTVEAYVALIKDINAFKRKAYQLLQNDAITQEEYDDLINGVGETQADIEKKFATQIAKIKKDLIAEIKKQRPKVSTEFSNVENDLIRKYLELSDADLESLSPEDLFVLNDLLENISNGEIDYYRFSDVVSKAFTNDAIDPITKQVNASKFNMGSERGRQELSEQESAFWEGLLGMGRAKVGALQKFIISPFNRAIGSFENFIRNGYNEFKNIKDKYEIKNEQMNKIGMLTTYLQEYMAQFDPDNKGVKDIGKRDWFKEILSDKSMRDKYSSGKSSILKLIGLGKSEIDIVQKTWDSLPKDKDGNVDPKAVYDSYIANDGKFFTKKEKAFFDDVMAYKASTITPKQRAANEISGQSFKEIPFHMLRVRLDAGRNQIQPSATSENGVVRIKAGTGKERTSQKVGPVMTNFEKLFISSIEQTGRDYFLSGALKDINNTLAGVRKNISNDKMPLLDTISYALSDALKYEFDKTKSNVIFRNLLSARAAMTLLNPIRTAVELGSTLVSYPVRAKTLSGYKSLFGEQGAMKKLLEFTDSPMLLRDNISKAIDINDGSIEPQSRFTKATNYLSGLPERTMMVTSWMPTFKSEFKNITGVEFDMKKFNDSSAYREKYGKAIRESSSVADAQTEKIIGPTTKAGQKREVRIAPRFLANIFGLEGTVSKNTPEGQILGFFSNYPFREATEFINGFREAAEVLNDEGALSSLSQLQKPLGVALNVAAYGFLSSVTYALSLMLLGDEDDEERGDELLKELITEEGFLNELASNAISLAGSKYAAGGKAMLQLAATIAIESTDDEEQKAKIKKLLKDSVFVNPLPVEQAAKFGGKDKIMTSVGMYVPQLVIAVDRYMDLIGSLNEVGVIYDKVEKNGVESLTKDEGLKILALNTVFNTVQLILNLGGKSIPAYNNIKTYMNGLKEEAGVADAYKGEVPAKKSSKGAAKPKTMNKTDMKRYFPEQYNQLYGPNSPGYEIQQQVRDFEKEQREIERKIKDQIYGVKD